MTFRFFSIFLAFLLSLSAFAAPKTQDFTLVIDAGHGGKDAGAVGKSAYEKHINLDVALLMGSMIKDSFPEVNVVYTRQTDVFLPLQTRANIVNQNKADLFISIHTNSAQSRAAFGVETFILGTDKLDQNLDVAMRENAVIQYESDYQSTYQGFDPNSIDSYIMFELMQNTYIDQSLSFATLVQQGFVNTVRRHDRGVRQAAFWVLLKSACPSILVELGFISNPEEEKFLASKSGKSQLATSLYQAFATYYRATTRKQNALSTTDASAAAPSAATPSSDTKADKSQDKSTAKTDKSKDKSTAKTEPQKDKPTTPKNDNTQSDTAKKENASQSADAKKGNTTQSADAKKENTTQKPTTTQSIDTSFYAIQIFVTDHLLSASDPRLKGYPLLYVHQKGMYKYYCHPSTDRAQVAARLAAVRADFPDAWLTHYTK